MRRLIVALTLLGAALLAGCAGHSGGHAGTTGDAGAGNAADARFVTQMTEHHEGAIEMAEIAKERAEHLEIRELAGAIVAAQEREIAKMRAIDSEIDAGAPEEAGHAGGHGGLSEEEMGMHMDPAELQTADPFDRAFIDMMIPHHEGAVAMAGVLLDEGAHPELRAMAGEIIEAQQTEIARMREWRARWYGGEAGAS